MQPSTLAKRVWFLLFLAVIVSYLYGLGHFPLVGPDEPRYAQVAREMYLRGDLITPTLGGHTWFEKPPLLYWMMMAAFGLLGTTETAARIGPALSGLLTVLAVIWVGRRVQITSGEKALCGLGAWSGLIAASMLGVIVFSRAASFDIVVTMTVAWALSCFLVYELETDDARRRKFLIGFYVFVGLSLLAKGLIGIVIPFGVIGLYYVLRRNFPARQFLQSLLWGVPLALGVAAIWYGPVIARHGWSFVDEFFVQHHFARYFSNKYRHPGPIYFYLFCLILLTLPWTVVLFASVGKVTSWRLRGEGSQDKLRVFALAWLVLPLAFFSFSGSKLAGYILPLLPAAALLAGERLAKFTSTELSGRYEMRATGTLLVVLAIVGTIAGVRSGHVTLAGATTIAVPLLIAGGVNLFFTHMKTLAAVSVILAALSFPILVLNSSLLNLTTPESVRDMIHLADSRGYNSAPVYGLGRIDRTAEFYASGRVAYGVDGEPVVFENAAEVMSETAKRGQILVLAPREYDQLLKLKTLGAEVIGDNGKFALIAVGRR